ncbi:hypothetical protein MSIMFI_03179 [Mycobacterium simulans]|nr:hypothetical protein MSIMFI_03179 [Mycobacterium simulans]
MATPVSPYPSAPSAPAAPGCAQAPANTPVLEPSKVVGSIPAVSNASQHTSNSRRCWGSMAVASRAEIPKNSASNPAASAKNAPDRV